MGYKLKRITIRPNGVEKQIRPKWEWKPSANTIAYYPLDSTNTVNDLSWNNRNLTNSWASFGTYQGVDCVYGTNKMQWLSYTSSLSNVKTVSCYAYWVWTYADYWSTYAILWTMWSNEPILFFNKPNYYDSDSTTAFKLWWAGTLTWTKIVWQRFHVVAVCDTVTKLYVNGQLVAQSTATPTPWSWGLYLFRFVGTWSTVDGYKWWLSRLIIEDKAWTADEVQKYYDQTKSNYWL